MCVNIDRSYYCSVEFVWYDDLGITTLFWLPDLVHRVHLKGGFKVSQAAWAVMKQQGYGRYSDDLKHGNPRVDQNFTC